MLRGRSGEGSGVASAVVWVLEEMERESGEDEEEDEVGNQERWRRGGVC